MRNNQKNDKKCPSLHHIHHQYCLSNTASINASANTGRSIHVINQAQSRLAGEKVPAKEKRDMNSERKSACRCIEVAMWSDTV